MPITFPTYDEIIARVLADIEANLPGIDPTIHGSFERAFATSLGGRAFDIVQLTDQLLKEAFPQTATGIFLERWAGYNNLTRNPAVGSTGKVTFTGTATSVVPISTQIKSTSTGEIYITDAAITLISTVASVSSLTRSGSTVTATTSADHKISSGMSITVAGAVETDYNGTFTVTVTASDVFEYTITGTPTTPATGTITGTFAGEEVDITASGTGVITNLTSGAQVSLITPISGVDTAALVQFTGLTGGTDIETDAAFLIRLLNRRANPVANFNVSAIETKAFEISGVTRILVKRITPAVGQVTILFVRDDDTGSIIPDAGEVTTVKNKILEILPATSDSADVIVTAPTAITTNFTFSALSPDTPTMRTAITTNLQAFYRNSVSFETDISEDSYKTAIQNTIDPDTGDTITSFTLSAPSGDITVTTNEIGVLGTVTYP